MNEGKYMSHSLFDLLRRLDKAKYSYTLTRNRDDAILVSVSFVGERIEVYVFDDGHMEVSRFLGTEDVLGGKELIFEIIDKKIFEDTAYEEKHTKKQE
jgi:hypothetical protein